MTVKIKKHSCLFARQTIPRPIKQTCYSVNMASSSSTLAVIPMKKGKPSSSWFKSKTNSKGLSVLTGSTVASSDANGGTSIVRKASIRTEAKGKGKEKEKEADVVVPLGSVVDDWPLYRSVIPSYSCDSN